MYLHPCIIQDLPEDNEKDKNIAESMMGELEALMSTAKSV